MLRASEVRILCHSICSNRFCGPNLRVSNSISLEHPGCFINSLQTICPTMEPHLSPSKPEAANATEQHDLMPEEKQLTMDGESSDANSQKPPFAKTPEPADEHSPDPPSTPGTLASFDWEDFETRYEKALHEADEHEQEILKQADALAKVGSRFVAFRVMRP